MFSLSTLLASSSVFLAYSYSSLNYFSTQNAMFLPPPYTRNLTSCERPLPRQEKLLKRTVRDVRADEFDWVIGLGDSITAGAFAKGINSSNEFETPWPLINPKNTFQENRGVSYCLGGDGNAVAGNWTVANILRYYNPNVQGFSIGNTGLQTCSGSLCSPGNSPYTFPSNDNLNSALSGAMASNLLQEINSYLLPTLSALNVTKESFKYVNLQIGSNDQCALCHQASFRFLPHFLRHSFLRQGYEENVREALETLRMNVGNTVVNLLGVFKVSQVHELAKHSKYCTQLLPLLPHFDFECSCAFMPGPAGDLTRRMMDMLADEFNESLRLMARYYQELDYKNFTVLYQPLSFAWDSFPIEALSNVDCFHPSLKSHQQLAKFVWNGLLGDKQQEVVWQDDGGVIRCLREDDRIGRGVY